VCEPARVRRLGVALSLFAFVSAAYFVPGASWSPVSRFCLTRALVERRSLEITPFVASTGDRAEVDGRFYTDKGPVPSFAAAPVYAVFYTVARARHHVPAFRAEGTAREPARRVLPSPAFRTGLYLCSLTTSAIALAALAWALLDVLSRRVSLEAAALATLTTVLGTPLFPYATSFFDHTVAAALLFGAFALLDPTRPRTDRTTAAAGALLALSVGTEYVTALPAVIVASVTLLRPRASFRSLLAGAAVPLVLLGAYHFACFGSPFRTGYSFITNPGFAAGQSTGLFGITWPKPAALFGILFGSSRGLFYVSPVAFMGVFAAARALRRPADAALVVGALALGALALVNASYYLWDGGRAFGPRHLVPALGFVGVGVGYAFERYRTFTAVLAGLSVVVVMLGTVVGLEVPSHLDVIFDYIVPAIREGSIARAPGSANLGLLVGLGARGSLLPIGAVAVAAFVTATRLAASADAGHVEPPGST